MSSIKFKIWEKILLTLSLILLIGSFYILVSQFPLRNYLFATFRDEHRAPVGYLRMKKGTVSRQLQKDTEFKKIDQRTPIYNMDLVITDAQSSASLEFESGAKIELGPNTMVRLAFPKSYTLDSMTDKKDTKISIISGTLQAFAGNKKLTVEGNGETVEFDGNVKRSLNVEITPKTPPSASHPEDLRSAPAKNFSPQEADRVKILRPPKETIFKVENGKIKPIKEIRFEWKIFPENTRATLILWKLENEKDPRNGARNEVFKEVVEASGFNGSFLWIAQEPGKYQWEISGEGGQAISIPENTHSNFQISPEFEGIQMKPYLFRGLASQDKLISNQLDTTFKMPIEDFSLNLKWEPYLTASQYKVWIGSAPVSNAGTEVEVSDPEYTLTDANISSGQIYYQVSASLKSGFIVNSGIHELTFHFLPPILIFPPEGTVMSLKEFKKYKKPILLTWKKTHLTNLYELEIAEDSEFKKLTTKIQTKDNFYTLKKLLPVTYWWRVRSIGKNNSTALSSPRTFRIML